MSLKLEIETWVTALAAYDANEFEGALSCFARIADTSKILFNVGLIHATLGGHEAAVDHYRRAVQLDPYLAVAYFQQGVSNFLLGDFEEAMANFNDALLYLRGNNAIDYAQLGLKFKLHACEVLFNRGLCYVYLQQRDAGMQDLAFAAREKAVPDHDVIDEAIREHAEGYTVFSIPVGVLYRPNEAKVKNLAQKDYLGKARLVAQQDASQAQSQSQIRDSPRRRRAALAAALGVDDRPADKLSYAATHLVKPGLTSRSRQQSEPPAPHRHLFPPTPPPEPEVRPDSLHAANASRRSTDSLGSQLSGVQASRPAAKTLRLELGAAAFEQKAQTHTQMQMQMQTQPRTERPRVAPRRAESERPPIRREYSGGSTRSSDGRRREEQRRRQQQHPHQQNQADVPQVHIDDERAEAHSRPVSSSASPRSEHQRPRSSVHELRQQALSIAEEDEEDERDERDERERRELHGLREDYEEGGEDIASPSEARLGFEIVPPEPARSRQRSQSRRAAGAASAPAPAAPPAAAVALATPTLSKIRVKVHAEDTRYVMATPAVTLEQLVEQIRAKFGLGGSAAQFKVKMRDEEGDLVTMSDRDDLDMAVGACKVAAARDGAEMGKMEVWVQER